METTTQPASDIESADTSSHVSGNLYESMLEDRINSTALGKADEVVRCRNFIALRKDRRYKTYNWYDSSGRKEAAATVCYKNGKDSYEDHYDHFDDYEIITTITATKIGRFGIKSSSAFRRGSSTENGILIPQTGQV